MIHRELLVLVASADHETREGIRAQLQNADLLHLQCVSSGKEALAALRQHAFGLIISDLDLSDIDAWRLTRLVRSGILPCDRQTPVIVVARTWSARILETTAAEYGVDEVLPLATISRLVEVISTLQNRLTPQQKKPSVLIIEDNLDIARLAERVLQGRFDITLCSNGEQGLRQYVERVYELVLLDIQLPGISGRDVLSEILSRQRDQTVVIMTAHGSAQLAEELLLQGASDFLMKPFRSDELRKVCEIAAHRQDYLIANAQFARQVKALEKSRSDWQRISEVHEHLLDNLNTVVLELTATGEIRFLNRAWGSMTGFSVEESIHRPLHDFLPKEEWRDELQKKIDFLLSNGEHRVRFELCLKSQSHHELWTDCHLQRLDTDEGYRITGSLQDITVRKQAQMTVQHLQVHDVLTGLQNRSAFDQALAELAHSSQQKSQQNALLYLDIDYFKTLNDALGREKGDACLRLVANNLQERLRHNDILCRLGDDEFGLLVRDCTPDIAAALAETLCTLVTGIRLDEQQQNGLSCSIGISLVDGHTTAQEYWREADSALFTAKQRGRGRFHIYEPGDEAIGHLRANVDWVQKARRLINDGKLEMHVQPVIHIESHQIAYFEALARLRGEDDKLIPPGVFIPAMEKAGDTVLLDQAVIRASMSCLAQHPSLKKLAVNLSARSFSNPALLPHIESSLKEFNLQANQFIFEITESASLIDVKASREFCEQLTSLGCELAIDDFGTGFSTFAYLKELPAHTIKIDGSFIKKLAHDKVDQALVRAISDASRALNKYTVAEYIEDEETFNMVRDFGIHYAQGYYFSQPKPPSEFV